MRRPGRARDAGLVAELQRSHRLTVGVLVSVLFLSLTTSGYLILVSQPRVTAYVDLAREARDAYEGMLDQETGLRGWQATGDREFLEPYRSGRANGEKASAKLVADVRNSPEVAAPVLRMLLAQQRWQAWAARALSANRQESDALLRKGKRLFDTYRAAAAESIGLVISLRADALARQNVVLIGVLLGYLLLLGVTGAATVLRRRRLRATILGPIDNLHDTIARLRSGELTARTEPTAVPELAEIGAALGSLAAELDEAGSDARARERRLAKLAHRFETIVTVGGEIAGSLSVRHISATVTSAAAELLGTSAVLWLRGEDGAFAAIHRSDDAPGAVPSAGLAPPEIVARAAAEARDVSHEEERRAYPLVLAGTVTAVLEVATTRVSLDTEQVLKALLSTAVAALESAHLHSKARELADLDALTQLPNRRRFEVDVDAEWERCRRYGRPMSLVMLDLDHFKQLNDEHGHLFGDQALREVATTVNAALRTTDTAYRYGGEEFVVLLRETGLSDATAAAERIRAEVSRLALPAHPELRVTTSAGVGTRHARMTQYTQLVAQADQALYEAKRAGRDRSVTARPEGDPLLPEASMPPTPHAGDRASAGGA